jgi:hypothetical protein
VKLRTNSDFRSQADEDHHVHPTLLTDLDFDIVTTFPYEFMRLVCLGVVIKLLVLWVNTSSRVFRLGGHQVAAISEKLLYLPQFIPSEFSRKPRSLHELKRWKATGLRQFLLYTGPIALPQNIPQSHFTLFL